MLYISYKRMVSQRFPIGRFICALMSMALAASVGTSLSSIQAENTIKHSSEREVLYMPNGQALSVVSIGYRNSGSQPSIILVGTTPPTRTTNGWATCVIWLLLFHLAYPMSTSSVVTCSLGKQTHLRDQFLSWQRRCRIFRTIGGSPIYEG
jgi:hypothetical protein